jgi:hypothetical protein
VPRLPGRRTVLIGLAVVAIVPVHRLLPPIGSYSPEALSHSLMGEIHGDTAASHCWREGRRVYTCSASEGSDEASYRVTTDGRCWKARRTSGYTYSTHARGCVGWRDQLRLFDRIVDR